MVTEICLHGISGSKLGLGDSQPESYSEEDQMYITVTMRPKRDGRWPMPVLFNSALFAKFSFPDTEDIAANWGHTVPTPHKTQNLQTDQAITWAWFII